MKPKERSAGIAVTIGDLGDPDVQAFKNTARPGCRPLCWDRVFQLL